MPEAWANAFAPTTALFGCTTNPVICDTRRDVGTIWVVSTFVSRSKKSFRVRTAMTTSSSEVLPARSPRPLMVHSIWRAPDRVHHQRPGRARRQHLARGSRHGGADAEGFLRPGHEGRYHPYRADVAPGVADHGVRGAAEQGGGRGERVRPRLRHPPGRRAHGARYLRDHAR